MLFQQGFAFFQPQIIDIGRYALIEFVFEVHEEGRATVMKDLAQVCNGDALAVMLVDVFEDDVEILLGAESDVPIDHGVFGKAG